MRHKLITCSEIQRLVHSELTERENILEVGILYMSSGGEPKLEPPQHQKTE